VPSATPTYIWLVIYQNSWTCNDIIVGADVGNGTNTFTAIHQNPASPTLRMVNPTAQDNGGLAVTTWGRVEVGFTNSTSDFIKCRSTSVTGTNTGNNGTQTGRRIAKSNTNGVGFGNFSLAEIVYAKRIPTAAERAALDAYCTERYGTGLV
jgi:hypothetical protein